MLFNSFEFILFFLPIVLAGYYTVSVRRHDLAMLWLVLASAIFYVYWSPIHLFVLLSSILFNYCVGRLIDSREIQAQRKYLMIFGIVINLTALAYYKYVNFFMENINSFAGITIPMEQVVLPLGISFFTFTQIVYLIDVASRRVTNTSLRDYTLFVSFFPHLIAGPIVHYREVMTQFADRRTSRFDHEKFSVGLTYFAFGLFKKVVLADNIAPYASDVFQAADAAVQLSLIEAWGGALAYTLQLYFDFSGYSDMAIGLALMFGIRFPANFDSPYKAVNIIDFWRRWHITLSHFLRDYLYIAMGGGRRGFLRKYLNLFLTMLIGGLWHGASWTFVAWGALHGFYLIVNHFWHWLKPKIGVTPGFPSWVRVAVARAITLLAVIVGWVFFKAATFDGAFVILNGMIGMNGFMVPTTLAEPLARIPGFAALDLPVGVLQHFAGPSQLAVTLALMMVALFAPNTAEWIEANSTRLGRYSVPNWVSWAPNSAWATVTALMLVYSLTQLSKVSEFLYYQF